MYCRSIVRTAVVRKPGLGLGLGLVSSGLGLGLKNLVLFTSLMPLQYLQAVVRPFARYSDTADVFRFSRGKPPPPHESIKVKVTMCC